MTAIALITIFLIVQLEFVIMGFVFWHILKKEKEMQKSISDLNEYNSAAASQFQECLNKLVETMNAHTEAITGIKKGLVDGKDYMGYLLKTKYYG